MPSPVLPSEFNDLVPAQQDTLCDKFKNFITFLRKFNTWYSWFFKADGTLSDEIVAELCAEACIQGGGGTGGTTTAAGGGGDNWNASQDFSCTTEGAAQTFTVPAGVTRIYVQAWGAGGGGGCGGGPFNVLCPAFPVSQGGGGGGGGSGGYNTVIRTVTPGETLTVYAGCGGSGGTFNYSGPTYCWATGGNGSSGGVSSVYRGSGAILAVGGGAGGRGGSGALGAPAAGGTGGAGGSPSGTGNAGATGSPSAADVGGVGGAGGAGVNTWSNAGGDGGTGGGAGSLAVGGSNGSAGHVTVWWEAP